MRWIWRTALAGTLLLGATSGCGRALNAAINVAPALLPISDQQEEAIGLQGAQQVLSQTPALNNATVQNYVTAVGNKLVGVCDRPNIPYHFTVLASNDLDAFSLPGGYVFITQGMLKLMDNEADLATVLGHEIGHVTARHAISQIRQVAIARGIESAAIGTDAGATKVIGDVVATLVVRGYGRAEELAADKLGALYASRLSYDPNALYTFLQKLTRVTGQDPPWLYPLETHPDVATRTKDLQTYILQNKLAGNLTNAAAFLQATASLR